jgi:hypothetical protein
VSLILDGFWLPQKIRQNIINTETTWITERYLNGRLTSDETSGVIVARWPRLSLKEWKHLMALLSRSRMLVTQDFFQRLHRALVKISQRFTNPQDSLSITALHAIPAYTGYSPEMIRFTLDSLDLIPISTLEQITRLSIPDTVRSQFVSLKETVKLDGRIRFYGSGVGNGIRKLLPGQYSFPLKPNYPDMVLGFAAGNVIGTSHLISLLAQVSALIHRDYNREERKFPLVLVKNSRQEPIFTPLLLTALEEIDPLLVSSIGLMIWDYNDDELQDYLISQSDLVIAAAADFTISEIDKVVQRIQKDGKQIRFHRHGHKISFTTISMDYLGKEVAPMIPENLEWIHLTALLSAVDSIYWDQNGCLSSRIHFIERGDSTIHSPIAYGKILAEKIRILSAFLPRGALPLHNLHNRFDRYSSLTTTNEVHLCSTYDDDFLVVVDERSWSPSIFERVINDCVERTIIVRPIEDIDQVPNLYLKWLPKNNLQTMSVAIDGPKQTTWSSRFSRFADLLGKRGVTAIRTIGRGPFPQMAYSWDGYLPVDLSANRSSGYFTTVEFENNYQQILDTYQLYTSRSLNFFP